MNDRDDIPPPRRDTPAPPRVGAPLPTHQTMPSRDDDPRHYEPRPPGRLFTIGWIAALVVIVVATAALVLARELRVQRQTESLAREVAQGRRVLVTHPTDPADSRSFDVPGSIHGFVETPVYAKIAGYLKKLEVDRGDRVKEGQVLAVLESPEVDQQVANARATSELQARTDARMEALAREGIVSKQDLDQAHSAALQAKAALDQIVAMQTYETIRAPFDGIVTSRNVDIGTLVPQATTGQAGAVLMLATLKPLRVFADVSQALSLHVEVGQRAVVTVPEYPGREFKAEVARTSDALNTATRTMRVEVDVPNDDEALYPGMYAKVRFTVGATGNAPQVPTDALVFRGGKVYLPLVRENRVALTEVALGYDDGRMVEIASGVTPDDLVAVNVGQAVRDGETVQPVPVEAH